MLEKRFLKKALYVGIGNLILFGGIIYSYFHIFYFENNDLKVNGIIIQDKSGITFTLIAFFIVLWIMLFGFTYLMFKNREK